MTTSRSLVVLAAAAACLAAPAAPAAVAASRPATPAAAPARVTLHAAVVNRAGKVYYQRTVRLASLERADVRIVGRTASSITVESRREGHSGPRATLALRIIPGVPDVLREVRAAVADEALEGIVTGFERRNAPTDPKVPVVLSAFRLGTTLFTGGRFGVDDVAVAQVRSPYGELRQALVELRVTGRTNSGANSFHTVAGVEDAVRLFG
jgi:hypothetical protein